jgi:NADPH:quinone reductase-like Zn-dependent oxidoreductase
VSDSRAGTVRAALLTAHGSAPQLTERPAPARPEGHCRVRVTAAPVSPLDLLCASGTSYFGPPDLPYVPGVQGVGVVEEGDRLVPGTRVWFSTDAGMRPGDGSLTELATVSEVDTVPLPPGVGDALAAALGLSSVAAWMALTSRGGLRAGERVLVLGAGGVVGQVAVQAAVALGASAVIAAARGADARERARQHGAAATVDLSTTDVEVLGTRMRAACDGPVDLVIDPVCGAAATAALQVLGERGRLVNLGSAGGDTATFASAALRSASHSVLGYTNTSLTPTTRAEALTRVLRLAVEGRLLVQHQTEPLDDVAGAWQRAAEASGGRVVVVPT